MNRFLVFSFALFLTGCLRTSEPVYEQGSIVTQFPENVVLINADRLGLNDVRKDKRLEVAYLLDGRGDGTYLAVEADPITKGERLLTVGGRFGSSLILQGQVIGEDGTPVSSSSYFLFGFNSERWALIERPSFDPTEEPLREAFSGVGLSLRKPPFSFGGGQNISATSHEELQRAFSVLSDRNALISSDWIYFDLDNDEHLDQLLKFGAQARLPDWFMRRALASTRSPGSLDLNATRCISTSYDTTRYEVRAENSCNYLISLTYCEVTKSGAANSLFGDLTGWSRPSQTCNRYNLSPGQSRTFTFVYDLTDSSVPGVYKLNSPLSYSLTANRAEN